ncbi:hypothetical protein J1N35_001287 [Gossypium stocksii]|uniref:Uncharacterized protein n=1 Tax=Gossypium stocksii TaxID=47602 RepID=A0A9D3WIM0_9ROSI|nr:hypothetical protein J1N35_001287 [Gossypium stocksii]
MKPIELLAELPPMREVGCASDFKGHGGPFKVLVGKLKVNSMFNVSMSKPSCTDQADSNRGNNRSLCKGFKGWDYLTMRLVGKRPRRRESFEANQTNSIPRAQ